MSHRFNRTVRRFSLIAALMVGLSGCHLEMGIDDPWYYDVADLEVNWSIDGSTRTSLCEQFGVDSWELQLRGPEPRVVNVDCKRHYWSSENDLLSLENGRYTVHLSARDSAGREIALKTHDVVLSTPDAYVELDLAFSAQDFNG